MSEPELTEEGAEEEETVEQGNADMDRVLGEETDQESSEEEKPTQEPDASEEAAEEGVTSPDDAGEAEPEPKPEPKPGPEAAPGPVMVPVGAVQEERGRRQTVTEENLRLKQELADARGGREAQAQPADPLAGLDEDDVLTVGQYKAMQARQAADAERAEQAEQAQATQQRVDESSARAIARFTAEAEGKGLDFASVMAAGAANLSRGDRDDILASKDPAAEAYQRCIDRTPDLRNLFHNRLRAEGVETVKGAPINKGRSQRKTSKVPDAGDAAGSEAAGEPFDDPLTRFLTTQTDG